jgi:hypothetical protein
VVQRLELRHGVVEPERSLRGIGDCEQLALRKGQRPARRRVGAVLRGVQRDHEVVAVVAAEEEQADERLVVRRRAGGAGAKTVEGEQHAGACTEPQKVAS